MEVKVIISAHDPRTGSPTHEPNFEVRKRVTREVVGEIAMAPIPPIFVRIAATFLTQILTRRLQQSHLFFRMVDRMLHEADHFQSHRLQGKPVPPYISRDPQEPTVREMAEDAWKRRGGWS